MRPWIYAGVAKDWLSCPERRWQTNRVLTAQQAARPPAPQAKDEFMVIESMDSNPLDAFGVRS